MINNTLSNSSNPQINVNASFKKVENSTGSIENSEMILLQNESSHSSAVNEGQQGLPIEKAKEVTDSLNQLLETTSTNLRYQFHEKLNKYYVTLVDSKTDEVVREIPNKKLMDIYAAMLDLVGVFVDEKI